MRALATLVVGSDYESNFERYCRRNWTAYANRHGYDLFILNRPLDSSPRACARPIYWQKNLILEQPELADYEQVAWIDSDIVINAERAPPVFEGVPVERIGAVDEYSVPDPETYRRALAFSYLRARRLGQPFLHNPTPQDYYRIRGFPEFDRVIQGGMIVSSPHHHRAVFRAVYEYDDPGIPSSNYEMAALSYEILRRDLVTWLNYRFNRLVLFGMVECLPAASPPGSNQSTPPGALTATAIISKLYADSYFLHFAGCQALMKLLGLRESKSMV
jgi:hypothetical protein